jgi:hypothetical protein
LSVAGDRVRVGISAQAETGAVDFGRVHHQMADARKFQEGGGGALQAGHAERTQCGHKDQRNGKSDINSGSNLEAGEQAGQLHDRRPGGRPGIG